MSAPGLCGRALPGGLSPARPEHPRALQGAPVPLRLPTPRGTCAGQVPVSGDVTAARLPHDPAPRDSPAPRGDRKEPAGHPQPTWGTRGQEGTRSPAQPRWRSRMQPGWGPAGRDRNEPAFVTINY